MTRVLQMAVHWIYHLLKGANGNKVPLCALWSWPCKCMFRGRAGKNYTKQQQHDRLEVLNTVIKQIEL